ncbi:MAG: hypothetical protein QOD74_1642 [Variibacter sp.]|nr:hypothetical protein [Variibacter sp.]
MSILERISCGYLVVDNCRRVLEANAAAREILGPHRAALDGSADLNGAFQSIINGAKTRISVGSLSWVAISLKDDLTVVLNQVRDVTSDGSSIVIILNLDAHPEPSPITLQNLFGLTLAETQLAIQIARGKTLSEVARNRRLSRTTVRSQLASIFAKTQTGRQAELVALLGRVAMLP